MLASRRLPPRKMSLAELSISRGESRLARAGANAAAGTPVSPDAGSFTPVPAGPPSGEVMVPSHAASIRLKATPPTRHTCRSIVVAPNSADRSLFEDLLPQALTSGSAHSEKLGWWAVAGR